MIDTSSLLQSARPRIYSEKNYHSRYSAFWSWFAKHRKSLFPCKIIGYVMENKLKSVKGFQKEREKRIEGKKRIEKERGRKYHEIY